MLALRDVSKKYNGQSILDRVSMEVAANEVTGLLGPSGCGKSTILKMFAGLVQPDSGTVKRGSQRIGFVFQEHRLIPWKTAGENVCFSLRASGMTKKEALCEAKQLLERVELAACIDQYPSQLSGSMCQRVSIARALAIKPDILLLDDPFSSLDLELKNNLLDLLRAIVKEHREMTVL
ncbi:MAG: nitrate ABC transporter ATP-binding protein [Deltaproteobacteria bacterium]|nr:MAG: nitrate ABC transporter ATP-binding protein [Deltaproteobacteria bacterium]